jgi:hypothetical protein
MSCFWQQQNGVSFPGHWPPGRRCAQTRMDTMLGDRVLELVIITTGPDAYRREDGIGVVPLALLGP